MHQSILFFVKSVTLGILVSAVLLLLIPQLRNGNQFQVQQLFSDTQPKKVSFAEAINRSAPSVVNIYSQKTIRRSALFRNNSVERTSLGSGVIMSENGYIITCLHVIQGADSIEVVVAEHNSIYEAQLIGSDVLTDLAVLKIKAENLPTIPQLDQPNTQVGDLVLAIGNPYNLGQTITQGIISAEGRSEMSQLALATHRNFIQMDAPLNQGNSGGALVDSNGNLVGINNANFKVLEGGKARDVAGVYFAVPYLMAKKVMEDIISKGRVVRGWAGLQVNYRPPYGIVVEHVQPNSPADKAGIEIYDVLVSVDGMAADDVTEVMSLFSNAEPGKVIDFEVKRKDSNLVLPLVVGELPLP